MLYVWVLGRRAKSRNFKDFATLCGASPIAGGPTQTGVETKVANTTRWRIRRGQPGMMASVAMTGLATVLAAGFAVAAFSTSAKADGDPNYVKPKASATKLLGTTGSNTGVSVDYSVLDSLSRSPRLLIPQSDSSTFDDAPVILRPPMGIAPTLTPPLGVQKSAAIKLRPPAGMRMAAAPKATEPKIAEAKPAKPIQTAKVEEPAPKVIAPTPKEAAPVAPPPKAASVPAPTPAPAATPPAPKPQATTPAPTPPPAPAPAKAAAAPPAAVPTPAPAPTKPAAAPAPEVKTASAPPAAAPPAPKPPAPAVITPPPVPAPTPQAAPKPATPSPAAAVVPPAPPKAAPTPEAKPEIKTAAVTPPPTSTPAAKPPAPATPAATSPAPSSSGAPVSLLSPPPSETKVAVVPPPAETKPEVKAPDVKAEVPKPTETKTAVLTPAPAVTSPTSPDTFSIAFAVGVPDVPADAGNGLKTLAARMNADASLRVQLLAFASDPEKSVSRSRRLSLERAVNVRKQLLSAGIDSTRIEVRALGEQAGDGAPDRVDAITTKR